MRILLTTLYAGVGVVALIGYIPTIIKLLRGDRCANLGSYLIWTLTSVISTLYAVFVVRDLLFSLVSGMGMVCCGLVAILTFRIDFQNKKIVKASHR